MWVSTVVAAMYSSLAGGKPVEQYPHVLLMREHPGLVPAQEATSDARGEEGTTGGCGV